MVRRQITVQAPIEHAFAVFTERFGDFKPAEHNLLATPIAETVFEPREGGHIYDRGIDGSVCRWARVLVYEPPQRVVFGTSAPPGRSKASRTTAARSRFGSQPKHPIAPGWSLEHRHLNRHGPGWQAVADGVAEDAGWLLYLARYAALVDGMK